MDLETAILSGVRQKEKDRYHLTSLMCEIQKEMMQVNLHDKKRLIDPENKFTVAGGKSRGRDS